MHAESRYAVLSGGRHPDESRSREHGGEFGGARALSRSARRGIRGVVAGVVQAARLHFEIHSEEGCERISAAVCLASWQEGFRRSLREMVEARTASTRAGFAFPGTFAS